MRKPRKTKIEKELDMLIQLRDKGFKVPSLSIKILEHKVKKQKGVIKIWRCPRSKCDGKVEAYVPFKNVICKCGKDMKAENLVAL